MLYVNIVPVLLFLANCDCARILIAISSPFVEHQVTFQGLWRALLGRGHAVTLLTTHSMNDKSYSHLQEIVWHESVTLDKVDRESFISAYYNYDSVLKTLDSELNHTKVIELLNEDREFDLVITEYQAPVLYALAEVYNCPLILVSTTDLRSFMYYDLNNPSHSAYNPDFLLPYKHPLSFLERFISAGVLFANKLYYNLIVAKQETALIRKHFGSKFPTVEDLRDRISVVLVNQNPILGHIRPLIPTIVSIGGALNIQPPNFLPEEFDAFMRKSPSGVIYVNLGPVSSSALRIILKSLGELSYNSIVRYDGEVKSEPENVLVTQSVSQQDVLRHPNIKLFVTHGELEAVEEAVYFKVPMLMLPMHRDQEAMVRSVVPRGAALSLNINSLKKKKFKAAMLDLLENIEYRKKMMYLHELVHDQPVGGLEVAVWWTDHVIRNKGTKHLKTQGQDIPLYQYLYLDVIGVLLFVFFTILFLMYLALKVSIYLIRRGFFQKKEKVQ
ncbi:UDP-glucuronosyltransferase 2B2-like [Photinus pyralis]|nr:UDP-glucuronosyltransferase 2B2-like [Photinus pyralis]